MVIYKMHHTIKVSVLKS